LDQPAGPALCDRRYPCDSDMPDEPLLREKAREAIRVEKLPSRPDHMWGGPGAGERCVICDELVTRDQLELEIQFAYDGAADRLHDFHLHVRCFAAWELERRQDGTPHT
jgi:hypothetical protein